MASTTSKSSRHQFVGKTLYDVPTPSVVLDLAKLEANCEQMLDAARRNGLGWRAHIKTHKTTELTRLQVGSDLDTPANIIVSTILEAERIAPLLLEFKSQGRQANVLLAFPIYPSAIPRLAALSATLGPNSLSLMLDHPEQVPLLSKFATHPPRIFIKIDVDTHRAGVIRGTSTYDALLRDVLAAERAGSCTLHGLYAHAGHSYYTRADWAALVYLTAEFTTLRDAAADVRALIGENVKGSTAPHPLVLSVGATPTATSLQHPDITPSNILPSSKVTRDGSDDNSTVQAQVSALSQLLAELKADGLSLEVHAGVYPTLDLQQLATHARDGRLLSSSSIAVSVLADVASLYTNRGEAGTSEALINAGSLALGREPCAGDYKGWAMVMPWGEAGLAQLDPAPKDFPAVNGGWQVGRISQEHGILTWKGDKEKEIPLRFGQRVRVWPNHSCIAGAGFNHYLVVDSRREGKEDEIVDVWERWNGW